jgi:spore coat protein U-like protein
LTRDIPSNYNGCNGAVPEAFTVHGRIPPQPNPAAGSYADTVR